MLTNYKNFLHSQETQVTLVRGCWSELFTLGMAQCSRIMSLNTILTAIVSHLTQAAASEKLTPSRFKQVRVTGLHSTYSGNLKLNIVCCVIANLHVFVVIILTGGCWKENYKYCFFVLKLIYMLWWCGNFERIIQIIMFFVVFLSGFGPHKSSPRFCNSHDKTSTRWTWIRLS